MLRIIREDTTRVIGPWLMFKKQVGTRVEALRLAFGLPSQGEMADMLRVETGTYNHWTTGKALIPVPAAIRLCELTGATLDYVYRGDVSGLPIRLIRLLPVDSSGGG
ncbi:hypothetical protein AMST5_04093 [freshwater sediment metagenome]|uniref:HTH cro/C1-type domain-containing protein n=1 Tax=freshwater sediment metagenome TaxID=556182 RepID=A0AA48M364_9ZZZZ